MPSCAYLVADVDSTIKIDVTVEDGITYDGVIHIVSNVLIPPKSVGGMMQEWNGEEVEVEDLVERFAMADEDEEESEEVVEKDEGDENPFWRTYL